MHRMKGFLLGELVSPASSFSDAISMRTGHGYSEDDMVILTDNSSHPRQLPTRQNMVRCVSRQILGDFMIYQIDAMHWLVRDARPNDSLFFHCMYCYVTTM